MITFIGDEKLSVDGIFVDAKRFVIQGAISQKEINSLIMDHPGYTQTLEHYLVLYKPYDVDEILIAQIKTPLENKISQLELEIIELKKPKPLEPGEPLEPIDGITRK